MRNLIKQLAAGSAGLTLALALISGGSPDVTWNSTPAPAGVAQSAPDGIANDAPDGIAPGTADGIANGAPDGIANRAFANPAPSVSYGPQR
jgi:hypothetical protein